MPDDPVSITAEILVADMMTSTEFRNRLNISEATRKRLNKHLTPRYTITGQRYYLPEDILTYLNIKENTNVE